jgi:molybdopterin/thiamine biosynthesis adenylyltransferase
VVADQKVILSFLKEQAKGKCIDLAEVQKTAETFHCSLRDIEKIALNHSILPARFQRNGLCCSDQLKLFQARVAIIGCGGLGGRTAELLARIGIGHLILTDPDVFSESNLNRQIFCTTETLGCNKVDIVGRELQKINPALETSIHINQFDTLSISTADIVIDALDSTTARKELSALCRKRSIPLIHGAVREWYGQVGVELSGNTLIDTLFHKTAENTLPPHVLVMTVSLVASLQAAEACKLLLGTGAPLSDGWLQCDLFNADYEKIKTGT